MLTAGTADHQTRAILLRIYHAALAAVEGRHRVCRALSSKSLRDPVFVIAIGKAACAMVRGAEDVLGSRIRDAFIVTKHGYGEPLPWPVRESGHPLPDEASLTAGEALTDFIGRIPKDGTVLVLLSGGASALVECLPEGMALAHLQALNEWLLASGFDIARMNAVRRRVSRLKGGRLAKLLYPRNVTCLAISDVPDDDPRTIGSGPLSPDPVAGQPIDVAAAPAALQSWLRNAPAAPRPDDPCFTQLEYLIIARLVDARIAAARAAEDMGYAVTVHSTFIDGPAADAGEALARKLLQSDPRTVHVWGGEPAVHLPATPGQGGRAQHMALAAARVLVDQPNVALLVAATDGTDGGTDDAGAIVDGSTVARGSSAGQSANDALATANSGCFLEAAGELIQTGPTGTNVMDLMIGIKID